MDKPALDLYIQINDNVLQTSHVFVLFFGDHEKHFNWVIGSIGG